MIRASSWANGYTELIIPKRRGGWRTLLVPSEELKKVQRKILSFLERIFEAETQYRGIYGLCSGSYVKHAELHSNSRFIFSFDLKDAFPSVNISKVKKVLAQRIAFSLPFFGFRFPNDFDETVELNDLAGEELAGLIIQLTSFKNTLPQGAPTSPFLFQLAIIEGGLFEKLKSHCPFGWKMSCYIDGFVFSGPKPLSPETRERIFDTVEEFGFKVNAKKICQFDCRQGAPLITGIRVDGEGKVSLPKKTIKKWRGFIHRIAREVENRSELDKLSQRMQKIQGFIDSLKPIYGDGLPPQIVKPYECFRQSLKPPYRIKEPHPDLKQTRLTQWM